MSSPEKIAETIYWVGDRNANNTIECNPYLIIEDGEGVLIDPGSTLEYAKIHEYVASLISLSRISLMVVNHPDPDIASGIPKFAKAGLVAPIALHWRSSTLMRFYDITNPFYIVNEEGWEWSFHTGRKLTFIPSPYCHFPGSIMTWDKQTATLFSGDLFGTLAHSTEIYAGDDYKERMLSFHEHYIPSHEILAPVMDSLKPLKIERIAPQHGQVITRNIGEYIETLRELECGTYLGNTMALLPESGLAPKGHAFHDESGKKDDTPEPDGDGMITDANTGLMNGGVFRRFLSALLGQRNGGTFSALYFSVDNLEEINQLRGRKAGDEAIRSLAYLAKNNARGNQFKIFKLDMPYIAIVACATAQDEVRAMAEKIRRDAMSADFTTDRLTVSAGLIHSDQLPPTGLEREAEHVDRLILARLFRARKTPSGSICDYLEEADSALYLKKKILLVEPDTTYVAFLEPFFADRGYHLMTIPDGSGVAKFRDEDTPDLVIAEAMTPHVNGFELREKMLASSKGKNTPFILISRRKDEEFIRRAAETGIVHFLKKPFSKTELLGLVDNLLGHR